MTNPTVSAQVEIFDDTPLRCQRHPDDARVRFSLGGIHHALDVPLDIVFEPDALRRFVALANEIAESAAVDAD